MAAALAILMVYLACPVSAQESFLVAPGERPVKDKWAVIVGVSKFADSKLNLQFASQDAKNVRDFLVREGYFAPDHVILLTDEKATRANVLAVLGDKWLPRLALPDDLVVLYFSSHGSPSNLDVGGVNYLVAHDTDPKNLYATGIAMQDLARIIKDRVHAERLVLILDACHSGAATPEAKGLVRTGNINVDELVQGTGQMVISSSEPNQRSWESQRYAGSVFTKYLIEGLKKSGAYTNIGEAFDYMKDKVQVEVLRDRGILQSPVLRSKWEGRDLKLATIPSKPRLGLKLELPAPRDAPGEAGAHATPPSKQASIAGLSRYKITIFTGKVLLAGTDAKVYINLLGTNGRTGKKWFDTTHSQLERGRADVFEIKARDVGELNGIVIGHDNSGPLPGWHLSKVVIENERTGQSWTVPCRRWLARTAYDGRIEREFDVE